MSGYAMALVGAQFGSEGKGVIAGALAHGFRGAIRVGGPNAGHSLYATVEDGSSHLFKMRSVPCAWVNPNAVLMIGAGAVINPHVLEAELREIGDYTATPTVIIDPQAVLIKPEDEHHEMLTIRSLIGSTGEGVGQARVAKVAREGNARLARDYEWKHACIEIGDVASLAADLMEVGGRIMLEGTQGSGLSLHHGIYPYVTSTDTNASGIAAEAGIPPSRVRCTHLVIRTFPIRVAGNSGPMGGTELSWEQMLNRWNLMAPEQTTVTKKTRRIATYDEAQVDRAVMLNEPCGLWVTFADYLEPSIRGTYDPAEVDRSDVVRGFVGYLEKRYGVPVLGLSTGPSKVTGNDDFAIAQRYDECNHGERYLTQFEKMKEAA